MRRHGLGLLGGQCAGKRGDWGFRRCRDLAITYAEQASPCRHPRHAAGWMGCKKQEPHPYTPNLNPNPTLSLTPSPPCPHPHLAGHQGTQQEWGACRGGGSRGGRGGKGRGAKGAGGHPTAPARGCGHRRAMAAAAAGGHGNARALQGASWLRCCHLWWVRACGVQRAGGGRLWGPRGCGARAVAV